MQLSLQALFVCFLYRDMVSMTQVKRHVPSTILHDSWGFKWTPILLIQQKKWMMIMRIGVYLLFRSSLSVGLTQKSIVSCSLHQFLNLCNCRRRWLMLTNIYYILAPNYHTYNDVGPILFNESEKSTTPATSQTQNVWRTKFSDSEKNQLLCPQVKMNTVVQIPG